MSVPCVIAVAVCSVSLVAAGAEQSTAPDVLPASATTKFSASLTAAEKHARQVWRDTPPINADGTVNGYIEISRGDRRKWEFDMAANARAIDRVMPEDVGGYPVNYGFVPQTISYDGDPFDVLVLGPALPGGDIVRGVIVGLMYMEDEKGLDSKVVISTLAPGGLPMHALDAAERNRIGDYFNRYKRQQPGAFSKVPGWGSAADGLQHVQMAHAFFRQCGGQAGRACRVSR